jgi:enoyl-CoA hydratase
MSLHSQDIDPVLKIERQGSAYILQLNRPTAGNSISTELAIAVENALQQIVQEKDISAIILTGEGNKFFCTGGDVKKYADVKTPEELEDAFGKIRQMADAIENIDIPVIAAINGFAIGGGLEICVACDLRVIDRGVQVGFPQTRIGLIPGWNGAERLLRIIGRGSAMKLLMTGDRIDAIEAYRIGLVDQLAEPGCVVQEALAIASRIALAGPLAIRAMKKVVRSYEHDPQEVSRETAKKEFSKLWFTNDHKEAEIAFIEKRTPQFSGS